MDGMKYISFDRRFSYQSLVIFPADVDHAQFARFVAIEPENVLGAGFIKLDANGHPYCHGKSTSLNVRARVKEDTELLFRQLGQD